MPIYLAITSDQLATWLPSVLAAVLIFFGGLVTQWQLNQANKRTTKIEEEKVDAAAYDRARSIDKEVLDSIRQELKEAKEEIRVLRQTLTDERREHERESVQWRRRTFVLQKHIDKLEDIIRRLTDKLREAGIDLGEEDQLEPFCPDA